MRASSSHSRFFHRLRGQRFNALLVILFLMLVATPVANSLDGLPGQEMRGVVTVFFGLTVLAAAAAAADNRKMVITVFVLAAVCLVVDGVRFFHDTPGWRAAFYACGAAYLFVVIGLMLRHIFMHEKVTTNTISAALCVYLLLGIMWALGYSLIDLADPDAFHFAANVDAEGKTIRSGLRFGSGETASAVYFSFVTLCTLGYGDIVPKSPTAEMAAVGEAIVGQLYLTVLVARLVGLHIAGFTRPDSGED